MKRQLNEFLPAAAVALVSLIGAAPAYAQFPDPITNALNQWKVNYGDNWRLIYDENTGWGRMLLGGGAPAPYVPANQAEGFALARLFVTEAEGILGIPTNDVSLVNDRIIVLPFGLSGGTDKVSVRFHQICPSSGALVKDAWVNVLFAMNGTLLSIDSTYDHTPPGCNTSATVGGGEATALARASFAAEVGSPPTFVSPAELEVVRIDGRSLLVWNIGVSGLSDDGFEAAFFYSVSAVGDACVLDRIDAIHGFAPDVGQVEGLATEEGCCWDPDDGINRETVHYPHLTVTSATGETVITDGNGEFTLPAGASPDVTVRFKGPFVDVDHNGNEGVTVQATLGGPHTVIQTQPNPTPSKQYVAQSNAFYRINQMRDWVRSVNPFDDTADNGNPVGTPFKANVNYVNPNMPLCTNAAFNHTTKVMLFSNNRPNCPNAAFAPILWHEMGHALGDVYGGKVGQSGFNEGTADVFSMYLMNYSELPASSLNILGSPVTIPPRSGLNTDPYCGDCNPETCNGPDPHSAGRPLMGALWKVRANLQADHGDQLGGDKADALFLGFFNAFNQTDIHTIIKYQWLVLDDDNADLDDLTPNFAHVENGFLANAFPAHDPIVMPTICR